MYLPAVSSSKTTLTQGSNPPTTYSKNVMLDCAAESRMDLTARASVTDSETKEAVRTPMAKPRDSIPCGCNSPSTPVQSDHTQFQLRISKLQR